MNRNPRVISLLAFILIAAILGSLLLVTPAAAADPGTIQGKVVNKTAGGPAVANFKVTLKSYVNNKETSSKDTTTDKEGKFTFTGVATESNVSYVITGNYQEADYESDPFTFPRGETVKQVELAVWEATSSGEAVAVQASHMVFNMVDGRLKVEEYIKVSNGSDKTYIGSEIVAGVGRKKTLAFSLPERATDLQLIDGLMDCCIQKTGEGFFDTMAVPPEKGRELVFGYFLDYSGDAFTIAKPVSLPTKAFNVLVPDNTSIQVQSSLLGSRGSIPGAQGSTFRLYAADQLPAGTEVTFTLSGLPKAAAKVNLKLIGLLSGIMVVALAVSYPVFRRRKLATVRVSTSLQAEKETLISQIARLDDDFELGKIRERDYNRMRANRKARLAEVMRQLKKGAR